MVALTIVYFTAPKSGLTSSGKFVAPPWALRLVSPPHPCDLCMGKGPLPSPSLLQPGVGTGLGVSGKTTLHHLLMVPNLFPEIIRVGIFSYPAVNCQLPCLTSESTG